MKNRKQKNAWVRTVKIGLFALVLAVMSFIGLLWFFRPDTSTLEKRELTKFPQLTWSGFWDGSFFSQVDTWYADTYPLRESMIRANQSMEAYYGIRGEQLVGTVLVAEEIPDPPAAAEATTPATTAPVEKPLPDGTVTELGEMMGSIYITDNAGYSIYYFIQEGADSYARTMNDIYARIKDKVNMYVMICPISSGIMLGEEVIADMGGSDEKKAIAYMYAQLDPGIRSVQAFDNLRKHNSEYVYFHTDHHWTQLGAYYAYEEFCKEKGITPHPLENFETISFENFLGTFYSSSNQSAELAANPDTVHAYIPNGTNDMSMTMSSGESWDWNIINDVSDYVNSELYATFTGGDNPFSYAHNENIKDGSAVMVVKDSYGNAFIPWLVDHYEHIYWVDFRYTSNTVSQMVEDYGIQDVIFQTQIYNATSEDVQAYLSYIGT